MSVRLNVASCIVPSPASPAILASVSLFTVFLTTQCADDGATDSASAWEYDVTYDSSAGSTKQTIGLLVCSTVFAVVLAFVFAAMFVF